MYDFDIDSNNRVIGIPHRLYCYDTLYDADGDVSFIEGNYYRLDRGRTVIGLPKGQNTFDFYVDDEQGSEFLFKNIYEIEKTFMLCGNV